MKKWIPRHWINNSEGFFKTVRVENFISGDPRKEAVRKTDKIIVDMMRTCTNN